ncbi:MAG: hypothetical protein GXY44_13295 [Phycisphaerales bacterium]|nr:hypothetical protein [Phycisphaerales bacterium]
MDTVNSKAEHAEAHAANAVSFEIEQGMAHVFFAYDVGLSIDLDKAEQGITTAKYRKTIQHKRRAPRYFEYDPPPLRASMDIEPLSIGSFDTQASVEATIHDFGAISVEYRIALNGPLEGLLVLSDDLYDNERLLADSRARVEQLLTMIQQAVNKPAISGPVEDYVIYSIGSLRGGVHCQRILAEQAPLLAKILRAERDSLSQQEIQEALACRLSFGEDDLVIIDWIAAILFDENADDVRAVLEFSNIELLEMRCLDRQLDAALDESYQALYRQPGSWLRLFGARDKDLRRVAELQVDGALLFEGVHNAIKLLGDQYLARVYRSTSKRLHLHEWEAGILRKLQVLESIYEKLSDHHAHWRMEVLEWIIIILIALSIVFAFWPGY